MNQLSAPPRPTRAWGQIALVAAVVCIALLGWVAFLVKSSSASKEKQSLEKRLTAAQTDYDQKEKLAHLTDEELALAQAKAYSSTVVNQKADQQLSNFRIKKLEGGFATVFADYPGGGGPATYLKKVGQIWTVILVTSDPLDADIKAKYGMPAAY